MAFVTYSPLAGRGCRHKANFHGTKMSIAPQLPFAPGVLSLQNEGAYAVMAAANALEERTGQSVVHLEIGQPAFDTPMHIADAGVSAIRSGQTRYSAPPGIPSLRTAIAEWACQNRHLSYVTAENVVVGPGAKPGLFFTTLALIRGPEDRVIIPDPGFPTYSAMVSVAGGTPVPVPLRDDMRSFDMEALRQAVDSNTRLIVINSPGNPTGGVMPHQDLEEIAQLARRHNCWVMSDEIYSQLVYEEEYKSIATLPGMAERCIVVDGFSKSYCMTGWRLGWAIMPKELAQRVELLLVHSVGCTATFVQEAGVAAIQRANDGGVQSMRDEFRRRRDIVVTGLNRMDGVKCAYPQGAFYAWADIRELNKSSKQIADFLLNDGFVATLPGTDFGNGGEGFIRLSYVSEENVLRNGLQRMEASLKRLV